MSILQKMQCYFVILFPLFSCFPMERVNNLANVSHDKSNTYLERLMDLRAYIISNRVQLTAELFPVILAKIINLEVLIQQDIVNANSNRDDLVGSPIDPVSNVMLFRPIREALHNADRSTEAMPFIPEPQAPQAWQNPYQESIMPEPALSLILEPKAEPTQQIPPLASAAPAARLRFIPAKAHQEVHTMQEPIETKAGQVLKKGNLVGEIDGLITQDLKFKDFVPRGKRPTKKVGSAKKRSRRPAEKAASDLRNSINAISI